MRPSGGFRRVERLRRWPAETLIRLVITLLTAASVSCSTGSRIEGYAHYRLSTNPTTLDPALIVDVTGGQIAAKIFNGLVRLDEGLRLAPDIAESWEVREGGTLYVFHLRNGIFFHNNREVTAEDFKFSFKRILSPSGRSPNTWVLERIMGASEYSRGRAGDVSGIIVEDRYTLKIRLDEPFSPFLHLLTMTAAYVVPREEVERLGPDFGSRPLGTGPFVFASWRHNSALVLNNNPRYFGVPARIRGLVYRVIPEDLTAVAEFELGNLDVIGLPAAEYSRFRQDRKWADLIAAAPGPNTYYIGFNCGRAPFNSKMLRVAVAHALDREKILRTFFESRGRIAHGPVPDIIRQWRPPDPYGYDPQKARSLLAGNATSGSAIDFFIPAEQEVVDIAEIIQSYMRQVGLVVRIRQLEWSAYKDALNRGEADMFWIGWWADYPDPENFLFPLFHSSNHGAGGNRTRYSNPEVDRLIELGQRALDPSRRKEYYGRAEHMIVEDSPWVAFWHRTDYLVRQASLKGFRTYPIYSMDKGTEVHF